MKSLQNNREISVYSNPAVQLIVMHQWETYWKRKSFCFILAPLILQVIVFTIWSCSYLPNKERADRNLGNVLEISSFCLALYFVIIETCSSAAAFFSKDEKKSTYRQSSVEFLLSFASPGMILACQAISYFSESKLTEEPMFWYWEFVAWTAFILWVRMGLMLRSTKTLSQTIAMIQISANKMISYLIIVVIGVMAFTNTFLAVRQVVYITMAGSGNEDAPERPFERDMVVTDFWSFKDKWLGEYISIWQEVFVGAVIGLEGDNAVGFTDTQWLLFLVAIIFNTIILMNLLLAIVGFVQGEIQETKEEYYFQ